MISKLELINLNKEFDKGKLVNESSLDFALSYAKDSKDWMKQLSFVVRSILIDHVFEEGNKRTASALIVGIFENQKVAYDPHKVDEIVIEILKKNIKNIGIIRRLLRDAIR